MPRDLAPTRNRLALTPESKARQIVGAHKGGEERRQQRLDGIAFADRGRRDQPYKAMLDRLYGAEA